MFLQQLRQFQQLKYARQENTVLYKLIYLTAQLDMNVLLVHQFKYHAHPVQYALEVQIKPLVLVVNIVQEALRLEQKQHVKKVLPA
jgi:hypothetical protein